jgi:hypothetical protein
MSLKNLFISQMAIALFVFLTGLGVNSVASADYCEEIAALVDYGVIGNEDFNYGNNSTINGNVISGDGNTPTPTGIVETVELTFPSIDPDQFINSSEADGNIENPSNNIQEGNYGDIEVDNQETIRFEGGEYFINKLDVGNQAVVYFGPGTYFIKDFSAGNGLRADVDPSGPVKLYIKNSLSAGNEFYLNANGDVSDMMVFLYEGSDMSIGNGNEGTTEFNFNGSIFSPFTDTSINLGNSNTIQGAILTAGEINVGNNTTFNYSDEVQATILEAFGCGSSATLHHYRIEHPSEALTCQAANITIRACIDENCSEEFADPTTVTFSIYAEDTGDLVSSNMYTFTGNIDLPLRHTTAETLYLRLENPSIGAENNLYCNNVESINQQCWIEFVDSGLLIEIPDNAPAYSSVEGTIKAVRADPNNPESCAEYDGFLGERTINFGFEYINPANGSNFPELNGESLPDGIELDFGANAEANFDIYYEDAGKIKLHADYTGEIDSEEEGLELVTLEATGNREIVFYPTHFRIKAYKDEDGSPGEELVYDEDHNNSPKWVAGQPFFMLIEAGVWDEDNELLRITPNFQTTNLQLATSWAGPAPPVGEEWIEVGILEADNFTMTSGSHWLGEDGPGQQIDEVGAFHVTITAPETYLGISDFLENKIIKDSTDDWSNTEAGIGRFYPGHFQLTQVDLINRVESSCSDSTFTYMGENLEFSYKLTAKNTGGDTTENYTGDFAKFHGDSDVYEDWGENEIYKIWAKYTKSNGDEDWLTEDDRIIVEDMNILNEEGNILDWNDPDDIKWKDGKATFSVLLNIKRDTPPDGPFSDVRLGVLLQDNDKIKIDPIDEVISGEDVDWVQATPISTELRYGRLEVANAHGSELLPIKDIEVSAEYYDETIDLFRLNNIDSCTSYDAGEIDWNDARYFDGLSQNISATGTGNLVKGRNTFSIHQAGDPETGPGTTGYVLYESPTESYLQYDWNGDDNYDDNPTARATFGIYKGNERIIYLRETTWR